VAVSSRVTRFHLLGDTRQTAEQSEFFGWFSLLVVGEEVLTPTRRTVHYRSEGPAFRALAEIVLTVDESDRLHGLELRMARRFIDHPRDGLFARDIAKSLIRSGQSGENTARLADLANEIEFPTDLAVPVLTARTATVPVPAEPTPGYLVFLGRRGRYDERWADRSFSVENYVRDGTPWLRMVLVVR